MLVDFVRVPAQQRGMCCGCVHFARDGSCNTVNGVKLEDSGTCFDDGGKYIWAKVEPTVTGKVSARANDPATSKGKRKVNKYEQAVLDLLNCEPHGPQNAGLTGKEMAIYTGHPLNCITPRFAPLRRKGLIKDSGVRRDKQIVWLLC